jgi:hypothetical protein
MISDKTIKTITKISANVLVTSALIFHFVFFFLIHCIFFGSNLADYVHENNLIDTLTSILYASALGMIWGLVMGCFNVILVLYKFCRNE